jgi:hypothetical protein
MDYDIAKEWLQQRAHRTISKDSQDFLIMENLLKNHPDYNKWINTDIEYFKITRAPKKKSLQVYMKMEGISRSRLVSWTACVTGKKRKVNNLGQTFNKSDLSAAMRTTIGNQIHEFSNTHLVKKCSLCNSYLNIEVDHYPKKFRDIKKEFLKIAEDKGEEIPSLYFLRSKWIFSEKIGSTFAEDWYNFHLEQAEYRYLCSTCNQQSH